jgi:hypothetical protein
MKVVNPAINIELCKALSEKHRLSLSRVTLIINVRLDKEESQRNINFYFLLHWIEYNYGDSFDVLIIEQDVSSKVNLEGYNRKIRHELVFNNRLFNRGWGFNVAVKNLCENSDVVVFLDTDVLPNEGLVLSALNCLNNLYCAATPYSHIYYSNVNEAEKIRINKKFLFVPNLDNILNPVTITGGIFIVRKEVFNNVNGFEQYTGYGGEDRALDVTLMNTIGADRIEIRNDTYVHLFHQREDIDRSNTSAIMNHLFEHYGCAWSKEIKVDEYIHRLCSHKVKDSVKWLVEQKKISYGDIDLYKKNNIISINGVDEKRLYNEPILPIYRKKIREKDYQIALAYIENYQRKYINAPQIFKKIKNKLIQEIVNEKLKNKHYDFVFLPHKKYHTEEFISTLMLLQQNGYSAILINLSPQHPDEGAYIEKYGKLFINYIDLFTLGTKISCIVCANDWERPVVQPLLRIANFYNIPTVAIVEGVNDFHDIDIRKPGSPGHYRNAYGTANNVIVNGLFDKKYFTNISQNIFIGGISRLKALAGYREQRTLQNKSKNKVLINLNFSYGVLKNEAENWLITITKVCKELGLDYLINKHPQDNTQTNGFIISKNSLYEDLVQCDVFITRFSGAVFEALTIGIPLIYFNPKIEKNDKFNDPMGAYLYANNEHILRECLHNIIENDLTLNPEEFLNNHAGGNPISDGYSPENKIFEILKSVQRPLNNFGEVSHLFISSLKNFYDSQSKLVKHPIFDINTSLDSNYLKIKNISYCRCINVDIARLNNKIVILNGKLYQLKHANSENASLNLILPELLNEVKTDEEIIVYQIESNLLNFPITGFVFNINELKSELSPGLTFLIRAKNEYRNIFFVLGSLRTVLRNKRFNCEVVFVDNNSDDGTYDEVIRVCKENEIDNVFLFKYEINISKSGDEHVSLPAKNQMYRSLDTYYNWCLSKSNKFNVVKWDADFLAINDNLVELIERYNLHTTSENLAIWFSGKTLYKFQDRSYINKDTEYNEFRVFSNLCGYKWEYAPRWEISSHEYLTSCKKLIFSKSVFLELKDCEINEFANRSNASFIESCPRDTRDHRLIEMVKSNSISEKGLNDIGLSNDAIQSLEFNPLLPKNYDTFIFNNLEVTFKELAGAQGYWINDYSKKNNKIKFIREDNIIIQGLWVGDRISDLHRLCIESFIKAGHCYVLYTYGHVDNVPPEVVFMNAEYIIPSTMIYSFNGSFAGFSDLFRSKLMEIKGGWYVDLDIFCLKPLDIQSDYVFSLDHYSNASPVVTSIDGIQIMPINDKYYCATNPLKLQPRTELTSWIYTSVLKKLLLNKILKDFFKDNVDNIFSLIELNFYLNKIKMFGDFESYILCGKKLPKLFTFNELINFIGISLDQVGQKYWNEIGPKLISEAAIRFGMDKSMYEPIWFQGLIPYYEVEKYISADFNYMPGVQHPNAYSVDFFFTMWKNKGLLDNKQISEGSFYKYLEGYVKH